MIFLGVNTTAPTDLGHSTDAVSEFVIAVLQHGMVYCCVWGQGCERFHDVVDDIVVQDGLSERRCIGPTPDDVIMTTRHAAKTFIGEISDSQCALNVHSLNPFTPRDE